MKLKVNVLWFLILMYVFIFIGILGIENEWSIIIFMKIYVNNGMYE